MIRTLPNFALEVYLGQYEISLRHHLTASDAQTLTISELLAFGGDDSRDAFDSLALGYISTWGTSGWIASRDRSVLHHLERAKHYTSICNAGPSEFLAALALRNADQIRQRNQQIVAANLPALEEMFGAHTDLIEWWRPQGSCVAFPRYLGAEGVEAFCESLVNERSAVLLPSSIYKSQLCEIPNDRFRIGFGRLGLGAGWAELDAHLTSRSARRALSRRPL
jgi:hypothetical protein